ncbi:MAG TPA: TrmH family RNA methyltransferase [Candidatus Kapabacteria bacterium]|nr:RNA methyltransferase [Candidatus Kapabacteria bacterium]HOV91630.1 TrmH family RNA methyltransferase [Candidatus Kapabacteria bacterium]
MRADFSQFKTNDRINKIRQVLERRQPDFSLILENINDPHNLSAVIRSCDSVGIYEVCLLYHSGQKMPKLSKTSSSSAIKWMQFKIFDNVSDCVIYIHSQGKKIYTTKLNTNAISLYEIDFIQPIALAFGNEHSGISDELFLQADDNFIIPQVGMVQSLNISVAAAISLYEGYRQRCNAGFYSSPRLDPQLFEKLIKEWSAK